MILRRCHFIVVCDSGEDPDFTLESMGRAVRKIRVDLSVPIEMPFVEIYPRRAIRRLNRPGRNCAIARIRYSIVDGPDAPDGILIYIKPTCYGDEPTDVYSYSKVNKTFPHETTTDQVFSESQFESYRMLGAYTMERLCWDRIEDLPGFVRQILRYHLEIDEAPPWLANLIGRET